MLIRLNKFLAAQGVASRRAADELIAKKKVLVNGQVGVLGQQIDPTTAQIKVQGKLITAQPAELVYLKVNKPVGFVSTAVDELGRPTVISLVKDLTSARVFPVGRLDVDSQGLVILTNDGALAQKLTHPKFEVAKEYLVVAQGQLTRPGLMKLRFGVRLSDGLTAPAEVTVIDKEENEVTLRMVIREGRNRQIRRMLTAINLEVTNLTRVRIGDLTLGDLPVGQGRWLTKAEVVELGPTWR